MSSKEFIENNKQLILSQFFKNEGSNVLTKPKKLPFQNETEYDEWLMDIMF